MINNVLIQKIRTFIRKIDKMHIFSKNSQIYNLFLLIINLLLEMAFIGEKIVFIISLTQNRINSNTKMRFESNNTINLNFSI